MKAIGYHKNGPIDAGKIISTVTKKLGKLNVDNLKKAHELQESGRMIGKNVLEGF